MGKPDFGWLTGLRPPPITVDPRRTVSDALFRSMEPIPPELQAHPLVRPACELCAAKIEPSLNIGSALGGGNWFAKSAD
jgi:hypothetical protein